MKENRLYCNKYTSVELIVLECTLEQIVCGKFLVLVAGKVCLKHGLTREAQRLELETE